MGVSGCGKTTLARALAERYGLCFLDADDFHSEESRARMAQGIPLNDELRAPWIDAICARLRQSSERGEGCTLAFSGLKKMYREPLRYTGFNTTFLFLDGDKATISERMKSRKGHFMSAQLLDSQFSTLEKPPNEPDVFRLNAAEPVERLVREAAEIINQV